MDFGDFEFLPAPVAALIFGVWVMGLILAIATVALMAIRRRT